MWQGGPWLPSFIHMLGCELLDLGISVRIGSFENKVACGAGLVLFCSSLWCFSSRSTSLKVTHTTAHVENVPKPPTLAPKASRLKTSATGAQPSNRQCDETSCSLVFLKAPKYEDRWCFVFWCTVDTVLYQRTSWFWWSTLKFVAWDVEHKCQEGWF